MNKIILNKIFPLDIKAIIITIIPVPEYAIKDTVIANK